MNRLFRIVFCFVLLTNLAVGQGIRATKDTIAKSVQKTTQINTPNTYTGRQIRVGRGGGYTGFTTTYYLLDNGKLFRRHSLDTTFTFIGKQTTARTKRLFRNVEVTCKIKKTKFDRPANLYTFVEWRKGKQSYKVSWGLPGVPAAYPNFVRTFMTILPDSSKVGRPIAAPKN